MKRFFKISDGNTALMIAVESKNLTAVKLLHMKGAKINQFNVKNGFTPLRLAIEKQHVDILKYILSIPHLDATIQDFSNTSPLAAAFNRDCSKEITEIIEKFMVSLTYSCEEIHLLLGIIVIVGN